MMKQTTIRNIQAVAKSLSTAFVTDAAHGFTTAEDMARIRTGRNGPGDVETIKRAIRHDKTQITAALKIAMPFSPAVMIRNILKSKEQFDFLATEVLAGIKRTAWTDKEFKPVYDRLFSARPVKYVQTELPL